MEKPGRPANAARLNHRPVMSRSSTYRQSNQPVDPGSARRARDYRRRSLRASDVGMVELPSGVELPDDRTAFHMIRRVPEGGTSGGSAPETVR